MGARILVAEDDPQLLEVVRRYLHRDGYEVQGVADGRAAIDAARRDAPDLLVLDLMLPLVDGLDVCRVLRSESDLPIIVLTALSTENDVLLGLDLGADDYMTKPFSPPQLVARVRALLRRTGSSRRPNRVSEALTPISLGPLTVDPARHEVTVDGVAVSCTPGEFSILSALVAHPGQVFTRSQLLDVLHGDDRYFNRRVVDSHIKNLRHKIEPEPGRPRLLLTVYGLGYKASEPR